MLRLDTKKKLKNFALGVTLVFSLLFLGIHSSFAVAPTVVTLPAEDITQTTTTLKSQIIDKDRQTVLSSGFEYWNGSNPAQVIEGTSTHIYTKSFGGQGSGGGPAGGRSARDPGAAGHDGAHGQHDRGPGDPEDDYPARGSACVPRRTLSLPGFT